MLATRQARTKDLTARIQQLIAEVKSWPKTAELLQAKPAPDRWNALECIEHLNQYSAIYLPVLRRAIEAAADAPQAEQLRAGRIGRFATRSMQPKRNGEIRKINAPKDKNPLGKSLNDVVLSQFVYDQTQFLELLPLAAQKDWNKIRIPTTLPVKWIKFRLGDMLDFLITHEERHIVQAQNAMQSATD